MPTTGRRRGDAVVLDRRVGQRPAVLVELPAELVALGARGPDRLLAPADRLGVGLRRGGLVVEVLAQPLAVATVRDRLPDLAVAQVPVPVADRRVGVGRSRLAEVAARGLDDERGLAVVVQMWILGGGASELVRGTYVSLPPRVSTSRGTGYGYP